MTLPKPRLAPEIDLEKIYAQQREAEKEWESRSSQVQAQAAHAYARLLAIAETSDAGQAGRVAKFIGASFNGYAYSFDLFDLRTLDVAISDDMLLCLDALRWGRSDLYRLVPDGEARVKGILKIWQIQPVDRP